MRRIFDGGGVGFADDVSDGGTFVMGNAGTSMADLSASLMLETLGRIGAPLTAELLARVEEKALRDEAQFESDIRDRGVAEPIRQLLRAEKKKDAMAAAKRLIISSTDLVDLVKNCGPIGYSHLAKHLEHVPATRELSAAERHDLLHDHSTDVGLRAAAKVSRIFIERTHRSVHLFSGRGSAWHLFFLTFTDVAGDPQTGEHHWKGGAHIHYMSHLFEPRVTKEIAWEELDYRDHSLRTAHIQFYRGDEPPKTGRRIYAVAGEGLAVDVAKPR